MRYSSFFGSKPSGLRGLGDVACERNLLKQLAAQFVYNLTGTAAEARAALEAFLYAYLGSTSYANDPIFPDVTRLLNLVQVYMAEFLGDSPDVDTLLAVSPLTTESLTEWSGRVTIPYVAPMTRVQAEAAMLLCQTPAVDPTASAAAATATAERARRDAETARVAAAAAASAASTSSSTTSRADAAIAAAAARVAAQFALDALAAAEAATGAATEVPAEVPATPTPRTPSTYVLRPGLLPSGLVTLTPAQRAALLAARDDGDGGATSYLPYVVGGGLLLAAAVVFASKSAKMSSSGPVTT